MAAKPCDLSIIPEQTCTCKTWGTFVWSFPSSVQPFWRRFFFFTGFWVNQMWLLNHVTYDIIKDFFFSVEPLFVWTFCSSWIGGHTYKVWPWSVQPLQIRRFLKIFLFFKHGCQIMWPMTSIFFLWSILSRDDPQKYSYWSDVAFYICISDNITKAPMTLKIHLACRGGLTDLDG